MSIRSPQCSTCLDGRPYSRCAGRKNCAHIAMLERTLKEVKKEIEQMRDSEDYATPKWCDRMLNIVAKLTEAKGG